MYNAKPVFYRIMNTRCVRQLNNQMMDIPRISLRIGLNSFPSHRLPPIEPIHEKTIHPDQDHGRDGIDSMNGTSWVIARADSPSMSLLIVG